MRTHLLKTLSFCCLGLALIGRPDRAAAQLLVGSGGLAPQTFNVAPPVAQWSTLNIGANSPSAVTTPAQLDAAVLTNTAVSVGLVLSTNSTVPPALGNTAQWNSTGLYVQSRANGNTFTLLKATLRNNTGSNVSSIVVAYELGALVIAGSSIVEEIPGLRAYYSLSGAAGSWVHIPELDSATASSTGRLSATLNLGTWASTSNLFLLWADDNGSAGSTAPSHEGGYTIDNFSVSFPAPNIFTHPQSQSITPGLSATLTVVAGGAAPLSYQWRLNSNNIPNATNSTYAINNAQGSDQGFYQAVVTNPFGSISSSNAFISVSCASPVVITNQPASVELNPGNILDLRVGASGSAPIQYQWYKNNLPISGATNTVFQRANVGPGDSGVYYVRVTNCGGTVQSEDAVVSVSLTPIPIVGSAHVWRYNQQNVDLGTAWIAPTYNDSTWQSGPGILGYPAGENTLGGTIRTVLNANGPAPNESQIRTYYFRTSFVFSNDPSDVRIFFTNRIDDGVILYLNGVEIRRLGMGPGAVNWQTAASRANDISEAVHGIEVFEIDPFLLVQGTNYLAGELHQGGTASSDAIFGVEMWAIPPTPGFLEIINQPRDLVLEETKDAQFTVGVSGGAPRYQWFEQGVGPIAGANRATLTIPNVSLNDSGFYYVIVSNFINAATSRVARLTVVIDSNAPAIIDADGTLSLTNIIVSYSERVALIDATNRNYYRVANTVGGAALTINSAVLTNGTNVLLGTSPRTAGANYILTVTNIHDTAPLSNVMRTGSFPVSQRIQLLSLSGNSFRFYDPFVIFGGGDNPDIGTSWMNRNYDDSGAPWGPGSAIFFVGVDDSAVPGTIGTRLNQSEAVISYFRAALPGTISPGGLELQMRYIADDGAVFYLNGTEIHRVRMPAGPALYNTMATGAGGTSVSDPILIPGTAWLSGTNVLAASLHQPQATDIDKAFAVELIAYAQSMIVGPVVITGGPADQTVPENSPVTFTVVQAGGATFQWRSNNVNIVGATNSFYTIPVVNFAMNSNTFSVVVSSPTGGSQTSTNATLRVVPDNTAPFLVSAYLRTNNTVVVSFSEGVSAPSATTLGNYRITNSAGGNIAVNGATISNGTNVILNIGALSGSGYTLVVSNVRDNALVQNTISPNPTLARIGFQGPSTLLAIGATWRFNDTGTDLGTTWRNVGFNETGWGTGPALLGVETAALPEMLRTPLALADGKITFYFRNTFNAPMGSTAATLRIRTVLDDGAVFYLNGTEIHRVRLTGDVVYGTIAGNQDSEGVFETYEVVVTNLVAGSNLLAVEVHQSGTASSDVVFGAEVSLLDIPSVIIAPPASIPVQITGQPQSRTNAVGTTASFSVTAIGDPTLRYQWRFNNVNISSTLNPTATNSTLVLNNVQLNQAGSYTVTVSNSVGGAVSAAAVLTVTTGGTCQPVTWTNNLRITNDVRQTLVHTNNSTTVVLQWSNPATNTCGSNAVVVLQRALTLGTNYPVPSTLWTNIYTNVFGPASVTNTVSGGSQAYYRLRVQ